MNPRHVYRYRARQRSRKHGLAGAGDILKQDMAPAKQGDNGKFDDGAFADDDLFNVGNQGGGYHELSAFRMRTSAHGQYYLA